MIHRDKNGEDIGETCSRTLDDGKDAITIISYQSIPTCDTITLECLPKLINDYVEEQHIQWLNDHRASDMDGYYYNYNWDYNGGWKIDPNSSYGNVHGLTDAMMNDFCKKYPRYCNTDSFVYQYFYYYDKDSDTQPMKSRDNLEIDGETRVSQNGSFVIVSLQSICAMDQVAMRQTMVIEIDRAHSIECREDGTLGRMKKIHH